jgi:hypothetical protein
VTRRRRRRRFLRFLNMDGLRYHDDGQHLKDCPKRPQNQQQQSLQRDDSGCSNSSSSSSRDQEDVERYGAPLSEGTQQQQQQQQQNLKNDEYQLKVDYAAALSAVAPDDLVITFDRVHECELMHQPTPPDPGNWNKNTSGGKRVRVPSKHDSWSQYKTVREYLVKVHAEDVVLGIKEKYFTQKQLVDKILESGYNSEQGNEWSGFVCITGGKETRDDDDLLPGSFGFCHQRTGLSEDQIGSFTKYQAQLMQRQQHDDNPEAALKALKALAAQPRTVVKTSFSEQGEVLTLDYFRFLLQERHLSGFRIRHFVFYRSKKYCSPYVIGMIQRRHDLKFLPGNSVLLSTLLKVVINGLFGFFALESSRFPRTRIVTETTLGKYVNGHKRRVRRRRRQGGLAGAAAGDDNVQDLEAEAAAAAAEREKRLAKNSKLGMCSGNVYEMSLIGVVSHQRQQQQQQQQQQGRKRRRQEEEEEEEMSGSKRRRRSRRGDVTAETSSTLPVAGRRRTRTKPPDLLYSITAHQPDEPTFNLCQASGQILGNSRCVFLGKLILLLRAFLPGMVEMVYCVSTNLSDSSK